MTKKKKPIDWTTEEAIKRLFPPEVRTRLKGAVKEATEKAEKQGKKPSKKDHK